MQQQEEGKSLMNNIKQMANITKYTKYFDDSVNLLQNWGQFAIIFIIGIIIIMFSIPFSSFLLINPKPFCMLFSLGSFVILFALFQLVKISDFAKQIGSIFAVLIYTCSLIFSLYAGMVSIGYFKTLIVLFAQFLSLIYILISQFPGGKRGMKIVFNQTKNIIGSFIQSILGNKKKSYLPL